jgi:septal ring factor EnvC (AmiA/AmiB activator)
MALGDAEKTKAIYIGIRAGRLEELACEIVEERQRAEDARQREEQRQAREASEARLAEAKEKYRKEREPTEARAADTRKHDRDREEAKRHADATAKALLRSAEKPKGDSLPNPEDFSDPKMAEAVRAMREALRVSGGRK